jgi:serine/threonine protein kinase
MLRLWARQHRLVMSGKAVEHKEFPRKFGKYHLLAPLAQGGMGALYLASSGESGLEKLCVIKTVLPHLADAEYVARFRDEAKVVVKLSHGNLVPVFDAGQVGGEIFLAMDFVEGKDLRAVWNRCARKGVAFPIDIAVYIVKELCRGLGYAHAFGDLKLVHRDVSPPNVLISFAGEVKLTDFGLASSTLKMEKTAPGVIYGKVSYMAPEQARSEPLDGRTDLYAAGIILWELLTGRQLFPSGDGNPAELVARARDPRPEAPSRRAPRVPPALDDLVLKALTTDRGGRYQTAEEMRAALAGWMAKEAPATDAARMEKFIHGLFAEDISRERAEREVMVVRAREKLKTIPPGSRDQPPRSTPRAQTDRGLGVVSVPSPGPDGSTAVVVAASEGSAALATRPDAGDRTDLVGQTIDGRYVVRELIGEGGMGRVYLAQHVDIGKKVALKILHPVYTRSPDVVARFRREARAASKIGHPNIVDVTDSGTTGDGSVYFVMEYLEGVELADVIAREGAMDPTRALTIGTQMCRALAAAHNAGIIHRDLKPENVFLVVREGTTDFVKILDFGIAKSAELEEQRKEKLTHPGMAMGTPEYMAPEQAAGRPADARSDVYAVAAILYEMLTGEPPYQGENFMEILTKKATVEPTPPRILRPELPEAIERAVLKGMSRETTRRPPSMEAFEYELTKCLAGRGVAVAKMLGMPVDPSSMSPSPVSTPVPGEPIPYDPPESALVTGRVSELGLRGLGSPVVDDDSSDTTEVVPQVPKTFSWKWLGVYLALIGGGAAGISYYLYRWQQRDAHRPKAIVTVPEELPAPDAGPPPPPVENERPAAFVPPAPLPPPKEPEIRPGDPQHDLFSHTVERPVRPAPSPSPERGSSGGGAPRDRGEAEDLLREARAESTQMEWGKARELYERVARGRHLRADGLLGIANVAWQTGDVGAALQYAQRSIDAGGGQEAHLMLGHAYLKKGDHDRAIAQYEAVLKESPGNREAQKALREANRRKKSK